MSAPRKLGEIYRESGGETPPAALDAAVLDAARASAETARLRPTRRPWHRRWLAPAGLAFSLLLGIGLALQLRQIEDAEEIVVQVGAPQPPSVARERADDATIARSKAESALSAPRPASELAPPPPAPSRSEAVVGTERDVAPLRAARPEPLLEQKRQSDMPATQTGSAGVAADAAAGLASPRSAESQALPAPALAAVPATPLAAQKAAERETPAFRASAALWLAEIRRQLAGGQRTSAVDELRAYVKVHGLASVPEELRTLLTP